MGGGQWRTHLDGNASAPSSPCTDALIGSSRRRPNGNCADDLDWLGRKGCDSNTDYDKPACRQTCFDVGRRYFGDDCSSGWSGPLNPFSAYVCGVEETLGGYVSLSNKQNCNDLFYMTNPPIWSSGKVVSLSQTLFDAKPELPAVLFLKGD